MSPAIILVRPQMGENIGSVARAMANFGFGDLRLVAPRDGWPNPKASDTAGRALNVVDDAKTYENTAQAVADCQFVIATTARSRAVNMTVHDTKQAVAELRSRAAKGERCAILFGPERTGLENEDMALADAALSIPVSEVYSSLNISHAAAVVLAEYFSAETPKIAVAEEGAPATKDELSGLFTQLEAALDDVNFWRVPEKKESMWRQLRITLTKAKLTGQEVATWRGLFRALCGE